MTQEQHTGHRGAMAQRALVYLNDAALSRQLARMNRAAVQTLLGAVQRATSMDEIEIILRYQQARARWDRELVERLLRDMRTSAEGAKGQPGDMYEVRARLAAEQLSLIARVHRVVIEQAGGHKEED